MSSSTQTAPTVYLPNKYYSSTIAWTPTMFNDLNNGAKAIIVEQGFIRDPGAAHEAIITVNLCGMDLYAVLDRNLRVNSYKKSDRENQKELQGYLLPVGSSSHFVVPPFSFTVSVSQFVIDERGGKKWLTADGFKMADVSNQIITYKNGDANGLLKSSTSSANINHYCIIQNRSSYKIKVTITKSATAYEQSAAEVAASKSDRSIDQGSQVVDCKNIESKGNWHFLNPPTTYTVRGLQTRSEDDGLLSLVTANGVEPEVSDYVELASTTAQAGNAVIFLADISNNGRILALTYDIGLLKFVDGDIIDTGRTSAH